jgi:hypothetical protein
MALSVRFQGRAATPLSCSSNGATPVLRGIFGLARLSLVGALVSMLPGCLVDDPPPYNAPKQTPPRLDYRNAVPLLDQVIVAKALDTIKFTIPFSSEDAGEGLNAYLLLDYQGEALPSIAATKILPASTLDALGREASLPWQVHADPGCHRLTLRLGHVSNLGDPGFHPTINTSDVAEAYWWMNVVDDSTTGNTLTDCPLASRSQAQ